MGNSAYHHATITAPRNRNMPGSPLKTGITIRMRNIQNPLASFNVIKERI
jgi:hypothetical protein